MRKLILAVFMVAFLAVPAFASVQNVKVSGDVTETAVVRNDFDLKVGTTGGSYRGDYNQNMFLTQARVAVAADLTDNVSTLVRLIDEGAWGDVGSGNQQQIYLDAASVQMREFLYSPLTVTLGRQALRVGNAFIVGDPNTNNQAGANEGLNGIAEDFSKRKAFDAVKLSFDYHPLMVDLFFAKINSNNVAGASGAIKDDTDLWGAVANYQLGDKWNSTVEPYLITKVSNATQVGVAGSKSDVVVAPGARLSTNPIAGLNVQVEAAWQGGRKQITTSTSSTSSNDNVRRNAHGEQFVANYQVQNDNVKKWKPVVGTVFTHVSGDHNPTNARDPGNPNSKNEYTAWDPMFEDQAGGTVYNTLFDLTNANIWTGSLQLSPMEDVIAKLSFTKIWLDREVSFNANPNPGIGSGAGIFSLRQPDGTTITPRVTSNKDVGSEFDAELTYNYTEDVQLGLSAGMFFPGNFFDSANNATAKQLILNADVAF